MSKRTQGFSAQGGGGFRQSRGPSYSPNDLQAFAKLNPNSAYGTNVVMCDVCGRPISSQSPYDGPDDRFPYDQQANFLHEDKKGRGRHFSCNSHKVQQLEKQRTAAYNALPAAERARLEQMEADKFNAEGGVDTRPEHTHVKPYQPKPGELSLDRVKEAGGVSNLMTEQIQVDEEEEKTMAAQAAEREALIAAEFEAQQALIAAAAAEEKPARKGRTKAHEDAE